MKKLVLGLITLASVCAFASTSFAALSWDTCNVKRVGALGDSDNAIKVTGCKTAANNDKWVGLTKQVDRGLAVVLTARSLGAKVKLHANFDVATTNGSTVGGVETVYLEAE